MADVLPTYRVKARNTSAQSENKIHDDQVARRYGFPGALVPGVTIYAYLTHPLVSGLGTGWLDRGTTSVRFVKPVLEGDEVVVSGEITERTARGSSASVRVTTERAGECAVATVTLPAGSPTPVNPALYRAAALPADRPPVSRAVLESIEILGTPVVDYGDAQATEYLDNVSDTLAVYRGGGGRVHPAFYLHQANRALSQNVKLGPWVHVSSVVRHLGTARVGDRIETRGRVRSLFEKKGREYVELDLVTLAGQPARPVAHVLHTAIYHLPAPA